MPQATLTLNDSLLPNIGISTVAVQRAKCSADMPSTSSPKSKANASGATKSGSEMLSGACSSAMIGNLLGYLFNKVRQPWVWLIDDCQVWKWCIAADDYVLYSQAFCGAKDSADIVRRTNIVQNKRNFWSHELIISFAKS